jgi:hypothetical protein
VIWKASSRSGAATLMCCSGRYVLHCMGRMVCLAGGIYVLHDLRLALLLFRTTNL